ncbi:MAG: hypothetical protein SGJ20_15650 [Planctomycetota bacterium]|nr:hypothetical protein [Planctomycetota bacterium]
MRLLLLTFRWFRRQPGGTSFFRFTQATGVCLAICCLVLALQFRQISRADDHPAGGRHAADTDLSKEDESAEPAKRSGPRMDGYLAGGRWREGARLFETPGMFKTSGERLVFASIDGKYRFACLENLNSDRVSRIVAESPDPLQWVVGGVITEFRGENYLLMNQAIIRAVQAPERGQR